MNKETQKHERGNRVVTLKQDQTLYLDNVPFIKLIDGTQPLLKATIGITPITEDDQVYLYNANSEDWEPVEDHNCFVVGLGDKIIASKFQILITSYSKRFGEIRFSLLTTEPSAVELLKTLTWR